MLDWTVQNGRVLQHGESDAIVLNHTAAQAMFPDVQVGDSIHLHVEGNPVKLMVVGIVKEIATPAAAYVTPDTFANMMDQAEYVNAVRISMDQHDPNTLSAVTKKIERLLKQENISVSISISEMMLDEAMGGHVYILIFALILMSVLMPIVHGLGLMSTMGTSVVERTREFGIMRTIGGRSGTVLRNVISEGVLIGLIS